MDRDKTWDTFDRKNSNLTIGKESHCFNEFLFRNNLTNSLFYQTETLPEQQTGTLEQ